MQKIEGFINNASIVPYHSLVAVDISVFSPRRKPVIKKIESTFHPVIYYSASNLLATPSQNPIKMIPVIFAYFSINS